MTQNSLETLYAEHANELYLLAYIHGTLPSEAMDILKDFFLELLTNPKSDSRLHDENLTPKLSSMRLLHETCMEYYVSKFRKKRKPDELRESSTPFSVTEDLIAILHLPSNLKTPLVLRYGLNLSAEEAGKVLNRSLKSVESACEKALNKLHKTAAEAAKTLESVSLKDDTHQRIIDKCLVAANENGVSGQQKFRRFKRTLDKIVPYAAAFILLICLFAYAAVEFGWIGQLYEKSGPYEEYTPERTVEGDDPNSTGIVFPEYVAQSIYVPSETGMLQYLIRDMPNSEDTLTGLMVFFKLLPEDASVSYNLTSTDTEISLAEESAVVRSLENTVSTLNIIVSDSTADFLSQNKYLFNAFVFTVTSFPAYSGCYKISVVHNGQELIADGITAQEFSEMETHAEKTINMEMPPKLGLP